jgi:hypothetical protein
MALYHFHIRRRDGKTNLDIDGIDFPDFNSARVQAFETARELLSDAVKFATNDVPESIVIADNEGHELLTVPLTSVLSKGLKSEQ